MENLLDGMTQDEEDLSLYSSQPHGRERGGDDPKGEGGKNKIQMPNRSKILSFVLG